MARFNDKIEKFLIWCDREEYQFPDLDVFEIYQLEHPEIIGLTDQERKYLRALYKTRIKHGAITGVFKSDAVKFALTNEYSWGERNFNTNKVVDFVKWDDSNLLKETPEKKEIDLENKDIRH